MDYPDTAAAVARAGGPRRGATPASPSTAPASARRSPPTRSPACARRCASIQTLARYARQHNGANVLALGSTLVSPADALDHRRHVPRHADARAALHPPAGQDPGPGAADRRPDARGRRSTSHPDHRRGVRGAPGPGQAGAVRLSLRAVRVLSRAAARRARGRRHAARPARLRRRDRRRGGDDRPHAAQARRDAQGHRDAVPRGGGVRVRQRVREPDLGGDLRAAAAGHGVSRLFGRRISARRDDARREALRDAAGDLRRRDAKSTW